jgi:flavodoxin
MRGVIAYDSVNGNTKQVAEAMAEQIRKDGHEAELVFLGKGGGGTMTGDFMFIGSPTRSGRMTKGTKAFVERIDANYWKSRPIVAFDTVGPLSKDAEKRRLWMERIDDGTKNAAAGIRELGTARGLNFQPKLLHLAVTGFWGPLAPDALDIARDFAHRYVMSLK